MRPTLAHQTPANLKSHLSSDQFKLYDLIWKRTIACQMVHATINTVSVDLECGDGKHIFRATGSVIAKPGFMAVYMEGKDDGKEGDDKETFLPPWRKASPYN